MAPIPFDEWTRRGVWDSPSSFSGPAEGVAIHHSVTNLTGDPLTDARAVEEVIWGRRFSSGFKMFAYSFQTHPAGVSFVGRGYRWRNGANRRTRTGAPSFDNSNTISICCIGNYHPNVAGVTTITPPDLQLRAVAEIIRDGIASGDIVADPWIGPHSELAGTACCGDLLRAQIDTIRDYVTNPPEETHAMALHLDAQKAAGSGIWTPINDAGVDTSKDPATREVAAIMAQRAKDQAISAIPTSPTAMINDMAARLNDQVDMLAEVNETLTAALERIDTLENRTGSVDARSEPLPQPLDVRIVGFGSGD